MSSGDVQNILENVGPFCGKYCDVCRLQMSSFRIKGRVGEINVCLKTIMIKIIQGDQKVCAPDDYNTESTWLNLTAWQPTARAKGTLDSH
jgi:hypothetical protein